MTENGLTIAVIPARSGSKRIPKKSIVPFFGHPMLAYTVAAARNSGLFQRIVVSTDDPLIGEIARWYGAEYCPRPPELAEASVPVSAVSVQVVRCVEASDGPVAAVCQLVPDCPLRLSGDIVEHHQAFMDGSREYQISVAPFRGRGPYGAQLVDWDWRGRPAFPDHDANAGEDPPRYWRLTGAVWWSTGQALRRAGTFYGPGYHLAPMDATRSLDIRHYNDLELADLLVRGLYDRNGALPLEPIDRDPFPANQRPANKVPPQECIV